MGLAARAAAGPTGRKTSTPCTVGQFIARLAPAEADGLNAMLHPDSEWTSTAIAEAINTDPDYAPAPLVAVGVALRHDEDGLFTQHTIGRHRRAWRKALGKGKGTNICKCFQGGTP
jgi:hypothetical protein